MNSTGANLLKAGLIQLFLLVAERDAPPFPEENRNLHEIQTDEDAIPGDDQPEWLTRSKVGIGDRGHAGRDRQRSQPENVANQKRKRDQRKRKVPGNIEHDPVLYLVALHERSAEVWSSRRVLNLHPFRRPLIQFPVDGCILIDSQITCFPVSRSIP